MDELGAILALVFIGLLISGIAMIILPIYNVWASEQGGKASLANAEYSKQVAVQEAKAKLDSASLLAQAEVERAKGLAQANEIIGQSLKNNDEYLRYLWIMEVSGESAGNTIIYVPTETNLPILEASRFIE